MTEKEMAQKPLKENDFKVILSPLEKIKCLQEILSKLKKVLYVYDKSLEENSKYDYKVFCGGILIYVSSSNILFEGELINLIIALNGIINNDFSKAELKRIVFESKNQVEYLISQYQNTLMEKGDQA